MRFADLGVREEIVRALAEQGIENAFAIQELTLPLALAGDDLIGQARTGMGKTFAFGVPLLHSITTAAAAGTTGPTINTANPLHRFTFNTQSPYDIPAELLEEWIVDQGTANGIAFVNLGNALPASHLYTLSLEWEE
jgi:hypothetical protein